MSATAHDIGGDASERCCQTNSNQSQFARTTVNLCGTKKAPLGKCRGAVEFEVLP